MNCDWIKPPTLRSQQGEPGTEGQLQRRDQRCKYNAEVNPNKGYKHGDIKVW
jgi:hypothetical protein